MNPLLVIAHVLALQTADLPRDTHLTAAPAAVRVAPDTLADAPPEALVAALVAPERDLARRAAARVRALGMQDMRAFLTVVRSPAMTSRAFATLRAELASAPASRRRDALTLALEVAAPTRTERPAVASF